MHDLSTTLKGTHVSALFSSLPTAQGLYDPANAHAACGVAFVATLTGVASNDIVAKGLTALRNLDHRGAVGGEPDTGDGAGILLQVPDRFLRAVADVDLPEPGEITVEDADGSRNLLSLRDSRSSYSRDNLLELAGVTSAPIPLAEWDGARCSPEFCTIVLERGGKEWVLLLARNRDLIEERALAAACEQADIVVADRYLPRSCSPRWLKADRGFLEKSGGLALNLEDERITMVANGQGEHGWWRGGRD